MSAFFYVYETVKGCFRCLSGEADGNRGPSTELRTGFGNGRADSRRQTRWVKTIGFSIKTGTYTNGLAGQVHWCEVSAVRNLGIAAILFFGGCMVKEGDTPAIPWSKAVEVDALDTVLPSGSYVDFEFMQPEDYMLTWGSPDSGNIGKLPGVECRNDGCPYEYICEFENYIGIRGSCGMALWSFCLLPKNKKDTIIRLSCDLHYDTNRGYVLRDAASTKTAWIFVCTCESQNTSPDQSSRLRMAGRYYACVGQFCVCERRIVHRMACAFR